MNLTLHYTHGAGYYEDYKGGAKVKDYKLPPYIDSQGDTIAKTDLVRRKWLENDFYGAIYSAELSGRAVCNSQPEPPSTVTTATTSGVSCGETIEQPSRTGLRILP